MTRANAVRMAVLATESWQSRVDMIKPRYVVDEAGQPVGVLLDIDEYRMLLEELEELAAIRAYDAAKDAGEEAIPFEQAVEEIERGQKPE
ncbi:MAG TPA: hypothetical protein VFI42_00380 [Thermomicrobiaceae bacterium]|nr:hypothetical protein [Thermomicrobiaceae bacterium]